MSNNKITNKQLSMLNMYYFMGYDTIQIANLYGFRNQVVSTHIRKALVKIGINLGARRINQIPFTEVKEAKERLGIK